MFKTKSLVILGVAAAIVSVAIPVNAQSTRTVDGKSYSLSGDSLMGINQRTANQDFPVFFINQSSSNTRSSILQQNAEDFRRTRQQVQINNTPISLEPGQRNLNGNDGLQVQFDLTNIDRREESK